MKHTFKTRTTSEDEIAEQWFLIDATGKRIGTIASKAAELLLGKHDPKTRSYLIPRTKVVITNAAKIDYTARRGDGKVYTRYSGYPGGLTTQTLDEMMAKYPERVIEKAIRGMIPHNRRGDAIFGSNLYVYREAEHKHEAQQPKQINLDEFKA